MSRYKMDDGTIADTALAAQSWDENTRFDGRNFISLATGSQWDHEQLYRSRRGKYYIESWSQWQGTSASARYVYVGEAAGWLMRNGYDIAPLPADLREAALSLCE